MGLPLTYSPAGRRCRLIGARLRTESARRASADGALLNTLSGAIKPAAVENDRLLRGVWTTAAGKPRDRGGPPRPAFSGAGSPRPHAHPRRGALRRIAPQASRPTAWREGAVLPAADVPRRPSCPKPCQHAEASQNAAPVPHRPAPPPLPCAAFLLKAPASTSWGKECPNQSSWSPAAASAGLPPR